MRMDSKVLIVGAPSEELKQELAGRYEVQILPNPSEWTHKEQHSEVVLWLGTLAELLSHPSEDSSLPILALLENDEDLNELSSSSTVQVLPRSATAGMVRLALDRLITNREKQRDRTQLLEGSINGAVAALFEVLSIVDPYSASVGQRLRHAVDLFAKAADRPLSWDLENGALLAEIGVLTVPVRVIAKHQTGQELSGFEKDLIAHVPERGADLLQQIPSLRGAASIIRYQSKNYDGSGLPNDSLAGQRIPFGARILKVVTDLFRWTENGLTQEEALLEMERKDGRYDPQVLKLARASFHFPSSFPTSTLPIGLKDLRPGQLLASNILNDDGVLLIRDGQVISPRLLHKLRNFAFTSGVQEPIYVVDLLESRKMTSTFSEIAQSETSFFIRGK